MEGVVTLNSLYRYTKHWFGPNGEPQMPEYQCNFCNQKAARPHPVEHLPNCDGIKALKAALEATYDTRPPCESKEPDWPSALQDPGLRNAS